MALKFRQDDDLSVLALAAHVELERLALILTHDSADGAKRRSQQLLEDPAYKDAVAAGDLRLAWAAIAAEMQAFGGDAIANALRGVVKGHTGVTYREIVLDVSKRLGSKPKAETDITQLEDALVGHLRSLQDHSEGGLERVAALDEVSRGVATGGSLDRPWTESNLKDMATRSTAGIATAAAAFLPRMAPLALSGIGAGAIAGASLVTAVTSPAFRVTLPAVLEVIRIRRSVLSKLPEEEVSHD